MNETQHVDTIYFVYHDEISQEKSKALMELCSQAIMQYSPATIYFMFSSGGGDVNSAITLYNFLKGLPCEIVMHNIGSIDSAANVVFMAGTRRYAAAHTSFLFHGVKWNYSGAMNRSEMNETLTIIKSAEDKISGILAQDSRLTQQEINTLFVNGETKSATFARDKGVISELRDVDVPTGAPLYTINTSTHA